MKKVKTYSPNRISMKVRILCTILFLSFIFYGVTVLALGYFYFPLKKGYFLLSGFPVVLIAYAFFLWSIPSLLTVIDHYDKRNNEADYQYLKKACWLMGVFFFFIAPLTAFWMDVYPLPVQEFLSKIHGFSENYCLYSPNYKHYLPVFKKFTIKLILLTLPVFIILFAALTIHRYYPDRLPRLIAFIVFFTGVYISSLFATLLIEEFLSGETTIGFGAYQHKIQASTDPAKFNAIFLTNFTIAGLMVLACLIGLIGVLTGHITRLNQAKSRKR